MDSYIYISYMSDNFTKNHLLQLLTQFKYNNELHGITGILLYHCGNIIQLIEGPVDKTKQLLYNIKQDPFHTNFKILLHEPINTRTFPDWNMGFFTNYSEFYNKSLFFKSNYTHSKIHILFKSFIETNH